EAWACYIETVKRLFKLLGEEALDDRFVRENLYPLTEFYLAQIPEKSAWATASHVPVVAKAYVTLAQLPSEQVKTSFCEEWAKLADEFISRIQNSLPEQSKDHQKSQRAVAEEGFRWFSLLEAIDRDQSKYEGFTSSVVEDQSRKVLTECYSVLATRNFR